MYEEKSSIDWKGLFLKVLIAFLVVIIAVKGYSILKGDDKAEKTTETISQAEESSTFASNMEKLRDAGAKYFKENEDKLPKAEGNTSMVTLSELIDGGYLTELADEDGKNCNGESSYVTATLDENGVKQKSNLVCGDASSYSLAYMDENAPVKEEDSNTSNYSYTNTSSSNNNNNGTSTVYKSCTSSNCTPSVNVNTNVSQKVSISGSSSSKKNNSSNNVTSSKKPSSSNTNSYNTNNRYYTVRFDNNGGNVYYSSQTVRENDYVTYPGNNSKGGCSFKGWYYNGYKYDFNTPVTSDMTLVANYTCSNSYSSYYDDDDDEELVTDTYSTVVYTMGWSEKGTNNITINHTLKLPSYLNKSSVQKVRIKKINYSGPINTLSKANTYASKHAATFLYSPNGWEATEDNYASNLSTINSGAVSFSYSNAYKSLSSARNNGFDVTWNADYVSKQCSKTFSVNGVSNLCDYGIYYTVTWEYQVYR